MYRWVGLILELLRYEIALVGFGEFLGFRDGARHSLRARCEDQLGAIGAQQDSPLNTHRLRHGEHTLVAAGRTDHRQCDPGVAAGRFEDDGVGSEQAGLLGGIDHRDADAVLDAARRIERLQLGYNLGCGAVGDPPQPDQGSAAGQFGDVVGNPAHWPVFRPFVSRRTHGGRRRWGSPRGKCCRRRSAAPR